MTSRARQTAIHEAGHALAYWWNGQGIYSVSARFKDEVRAAPHIDRRGRENDCEGMVEASDFIAVPSLLLVNGETCAGNDLRDDIERDLIHTYAGPVAEAIYRRRGLFGVLLGVGYGDMQHAHVLLELLPVNLRADTERQAFARCWELVRRYWPAICALADLLQERGTVDGDDVEALLCVITGESPTWRGNVPTDLDKRGTRHE